jgi:hypothetical protein
MSEKFGPVQNVVGDITAGVFGWFICLIVLFGAFYFGRCAAPHIGWIGNPDVAGLLSAIALVWLYEHHNARGRHQRLRENLDRTRNCLDH